MARVAPLVWRQGDDTDTMTHLAVPPDVSGRNDAPAPSLAPWQPWAALAAAALPLHFAWERLQSPLFESMKGLSLARATSLCARAALGDLALTVVCYGAVAVVRGNRAWLLSPNGASIAAYLALGIAATAALEVDAVYHAGRWSYASNMPLVAGIGLAPLLQWFVVPLLTLWAVRRYLQRDRA